MTADQVWWMALGAMTAGGLLIVVVAIAETTAWVVSGLRGHSSQDTSHTDSPGTARWELRDLGGSDV